MANSNEVHPDEIDDRVPEEERKQTDENSHNEDQTPTDSQTESGIWDDELEDELDMVRSSADENENAPEEGDSTSVRRGTRFRRELLGRIPGINYREILEAEALDLKSWLTPVTELKANEFLVPLEQIVSKREQ